MEDLRHRYLRSLRAFRRARLNHRVAWTACITLLCMIGWQITQLSGSGQPPGTTLLAYLPLWGIAIVGMLLVTGSQSRLLRHARSRLNTDRRAYEQALKTILAIARENHDHRGEVEAESELRQLAHH